MSSAETDGIEARFSPPQLGQTLAHNTAVPASSPSVAIAENTAGGSVYSLFNVSASDSSDFTSKTPIENLHSPPMVDAINTMKSGKYNLTKT